MQKYGTLAAGVGVLVGKRPAGTRVLVGGPVEFFSFNFRFTSNLDVYMQKCGTLDVRCKREPGFNSKTIRLVVGVQFLVGGPAEFFFF